MNIGRGHEMQGSPEKKEGKTTTLFSSFTFCPAAFLAVVTLAAFPAHVVCRYRTE